MVCNDVETTTSRRKVRSNQLSRGRMPLGIHHANQIVDVMGQSHGQLTQEESSPCKSVKTTEHRQKHTLNSNLILDYSN